MKSYLNSINSYVKWNEKNNELTFKYLRKEGLNPYEIVFNEVRGVKKSIEKHFPELKTRKNISETKPLINEKQYLKDLFKDFDVAYNHIIKPLIKHSVIINTDDNTFDWKGSTEDPSLKPLTLICILTVLLFRKDYIKTTLKNTVIASALAYTFNGFTISPKI